jgi:hypothetical protein
MRNRLFSAGIVAGIVFAAAPMAAGQNKPALQWEGMQKAAWKTFDEAWQAPGVNFRAYSKVMIDPAEVSFRKDWQRDYNRVNFDLESRITDEEAQEILAEAQAGLGDAFVAAAQKAGYQIVTAPAPDVLRLKPFLTDLDVHAPDLMKSARNRTYAEEAGSARLVLEIRDSGSGALLAGGVDKREVGDMSFLQRRSSVTNRADFAHVFRRWAEFSFVALDGLRGASPAATGG